MLSRSFLALGLLLSFSTMAAPTVVLDPGHTNEAPGVVGACGTQEVWVNDQLALAVADELRAGGYKVLFSKTPNTDKSKVRPGDGREPLESLAARAEMANRAKAELFISLHHDATPDEVLISDPSACPAQGVPGRVVHPDFLKAHQVGFNVFIHGVPGSKFNKSLRFAKSVGSGFRALGLWPSDFHVKAVEADCTSCRFEDKEMGVMSRNLKILRLTTMPSVLIEVTNLLVPELEKNANNPEYQRQIAKAIRQAVDSYFAGGKKI